MTRGFTLLEALVYLALLSTLLTGSIASVMLLQSSSARIAASARVTDEGIFVVEKFRYALGRAERIEEPFVGETGPALRVSVRGQEEVWTVIQGTLTVSTATGRYPLTEKASILSELSFARDEHAVSLTFTLSVPVGDGTYLTETFSASAAPP